ncbi:hypothetical protein Holit_00384 [Hollandina sp. SP2]
MTKSGYGIVPQPGFFMLFGNLWYLVVDISLTTDIP